jgi:hypothetical protein
MRSATPALVICETPATGTNGERALTDEGWTALAAVIAAITGIWGVALQLRGKRDQFLVGLGSVRPQAEQETMLHVVNVCDHVVKLKDYGFIEANGRLSSIPFKSDVMEFASEELRFRGSIELAQRSATYEVGYIREAPIGAYAISVTQTRPRLHFDPSTPYWRRLWIRSKNLIGMDTYA